MLRTTLTTAALTAGLVVGTAGAASAHECFVAKRSDKGAAAATHSSNWYRLTLAELYGHTTLDTDAQALAVERAVAAGVPSSFTLFERHTIPVSAEEWSGRSVDGKGVDSFFAAYGETLIGILHELGGDFPPPPDGGGH